MSRFKNKPLKKIIYSKNAIKKSKYLAIVFSVIMLMVIVLQYFSRISANSLILKSNLIIFCISLFLIFKPKYIKLWAVMGFIAFFVNVYVGGNLLGLFFYCSAVLVLMRFGFFKKNRIVKAVFLLFVFLLAFFFQYVSWGVEALKMSLFNIFIVLLGILGLIIMFADDLRKYFSVKESYSLSELYLTERQKKCFMLASQGIPYEDIAKQIYVSESVVKKEMIRIYESINVKNKAEFLVFVEKYEIID